MKHYQQLISMKSNFTRGRSEIVGLILEELMIGLSERLPVEA